MASTLTGHDVCMCVCVCLCLCTEQSKVALMCEREQCAGVKLGGSHRISDPAPLI